MEDIKNETIEESLEDFINDPKNNPKNQPRYFFTQAKSYYQALCELFRIVKNLHLENVLRKNETAPEQKIINGIDEENKQIEYILGNNLSIEGESSPFTINATGGGSLKKVNIYTNTSLFNAFTNTNQIPITLPEDFDRDKPYFFIVVFMSTTALTPGYMLHNEIIVAGDAGKYLLHQYISSGPGGDSLNTYFRMFKSTIGDNPYIQFGEAYETFGGSFASITKDNSYIIPFSVDLIYA